MGSPPGGADTMDDAKDPANAGAGSIGGSGVAAAVEELSVVRNSSVTEDTGSALARINGGAADSTSGTADVSSSIVGGVTAGVETEDSTEDGTGSVKEDTDSGCSTTGSAVAAMESAGGRPDTNEA